MKVKSEAEIRYAAKQVPKELALYFEIPVDESLDAFLGTVRATKRLAKIRTGGLTPDTIPTIGDHSSLPDHLRARKRCVQGNSWTASSFAERSPFDL